ncbi:amidohydrolase family protein [Sphingobium sp. CFD-2]|uniref:amidohydrolase family protein n=1 Tax=Sphingobium sp. CFD-2 TaxID=2878542 RepID=UPI00214B3566|nr:amidohydrolase [Sphingobium sp. CFD-2]
MALTLESLHGRIGDTDAHEQIPVLQYGRVFGERGQRFYEANPDLWKRLARAFPLEEESMMVDREDDLEITPETVWTKKGSLAPSAADLDRRPATMEMMGIDRQLIFPTMGLMALTSAHGGGYNGVPKATEEQMAIGQDALNAYNEWAGHYTSKYPDKLRVVGVLETTDAGLTVEALIKRTEALIDSGVKALMLPTGEPPAGLSPAHPALDDFYSLLVERDVALVFHPPSGTGYRKTDVWGIYPGCRGDVSFAVALHQAEENFLCVMLLGGVFERHPLLRVGVIENGASWLGPLAEKLDFTVIERPGLRNPADAKLSMKPSEYMARQLRVSVLEPEPVEDWITRYPHLQDCYCYSSDFPHLEGQHYSAKSFFDRLKPLGDDIVEKFFVSNPRLLLA